MKILVRLPNWLGDMVMAVGALHQLPALFPGCSIGVIAKKGLHELLPFFPPVQHQFVFSKEAFNGLKGVWRFGRMIRQTASFDLYVSFPDSFSSALMGYASGAPVRIGFKKEGREILLTKAFSKPAGRHRVEEYTGLLEAFTGKKAPVAVALQHSFLKKDYIAININSEASSRRLTAEKAVAVISKAREQFDERLVLIGGPGEKGFVEEVLRRLPVQKGVESVAGKTTLPQLVEVLASARAVLTTDSGPAHLANALGTQTIVLFGAGNENNTAPYNTENAEVIRLGRLSCEPCTKNVCVQFSTPQCLERLDVPMIMNAVTKRIQYAS